MRKNDEQKVNKQKKEKVKKEKTKKIPKRDNASRQEKKTKIPKWCWYCLGFTILGVIFAFVKIIRWVQIH